MRKIFEFLKSLPLIGNFFYFWEYTYWRVRLVVVYAGAVWAWLLESFSGVKEFFVSRMFWGRGSWYRNSFHLLVIGISTIFLFTGVLSRLGSIEAERQALSIAYGAIGNADVLAQGGSISSVVAVDSTAPNINLTLHRVQSGESLGEIAARYDVNKDTIIWANPDVLSPFDPEVSSGDELQIPEVDGVLYRVEAGDDVEKIARKTGSNTFDIVEINQLIPPEFEVEKGDSLFIPEGELPPPPIPGLEREFFSDPLTHPACSEYVYIRGFTSFHKGVDLAIGGGCPIRAVSAGTVTYAGWRSGGPGYMVAVDHGGGVVSHYYHGNGQIWVRPGDVVDRGQDLMYMGCTGNCTGTHLHFALRKDGVTINPSPYVPYYKSRFR